MNVSLHSVKSVKVGDVQLVHEPGTAPTMWRTITIEHRTGSVEVTMFVDSPEEQDALCFVDAAENTPEAPDRRDA